MTGAYPLTSPIRRLRLALEAPFGKVHGGRYAINTNDTGQPAAQGMSRNDLSFTDLASGQVSPATLAPVLPSSSAGPVPAPGDVLLCTQPSQSWPKLT